MSLSVNNHHRLQFNSKMTLERDFFAHAQKTKTKSGDCTLDHQTFDKLSNHLFKKYRRRNTSQLLLLNGLFIPLFVLILAGYYF